MERLDIRELEGQATTSWNEAYVENCQTMIVRVFYKDDAWWIADTRGNQQEVRTTSRTHYKLRHYGPGAVEGVPFGPIARIVAIDNTRELPISELPRGARDTDDIAVRFADNEGR